MYNKYLVYFVYNNYQAYLVNFLSISDILNFNVKSIFQITLILLQYNNLIIMR